MHKLICNFILTLYLFTNRNEKEEKEIYMYDIATQRVNKLNGELSTAFVNVAEENANAENMENASISDSGIVEQMASNEQTTDADVDSGDSDDDFDSNDSDSAPSNIMEAFLKPPADFNPNDENKVDISSSYSVITS